MSASILVVDDEPDVADLFRQSFRRETRQGTYVMHFAVSRDLVAGLEKVARDGSSRRESSNDPQRRRRNGCGAAYSIGRWTARSCRSTRHTCAGPDTSPLPDKRQCLDPAEARHRHAGPVSQRQTIRTCLVICPLLSQYVFLLAIRGSSFAGCVLPAVSIAREVTVCSPATGDQSKLHRRQA